MSSSEGRTLHASWCNPLSLPPSLPPSLAPLTHHPFQADAMWGGGGPAATLAALLLPGELLLAASPCPGLEALAKMLPLLWLLVLLA